MAMAAAGQRSDRRGVAGDGTVGHGGGTPADPAAETVHIKTRAGPVAFAAADIVPRRLGLSIRDRRIVLEYEVPACKLRALHFIDVAPAVAAGDGGVAELRREHSTWLRRVPSSQLEGLLERLRAAAEEPAAGPVSTPSPPAPLSPPAPPSAIGADEAEDLRRLLFGNAAAARDASKALPREWLQGWCFEPDGEACCPYGLRQAEGGPCGIVAPVQAFLLRRLLLAGAPTHGEGALARRKEALLGAMSDVLFRCAGGRKVRVLCLPPAGGPTGAQRALRGPSGCVAHEFCDLEALRSALTRPPFSSSYLVEDPDRTSSSAGVLLFLYSAMATRGADRVREDADRPEEAQMIGMHGYCTQEAVNLLLTGVASSNVFDGERVLGSNGADGDSIKLRGIAQRPEVGFLTLFEAFGSLEVGNFYKNPAWPIWVAHAESHYSVLFCTDTKAAGSADGAEGGPCDVWYYDPLGRQDEEKRITVQPNKLDAAPDEDDLEVNGMIAKVIRTKWGKLADLDWNGAEPIY